MSRKGLDLALERLVRERARKQCEYCLLPEVETRIAHEIDHPVAIDLREELIEKGLFRIEGVD